MGIVIRDETKDKIGEQLFKLVATVMSSKGLTMSFLSWEHMDGAGKKDYEPYVAQIVAYVESQPEPEQYSDEPILDATTTVVTAIADTKGFGTAGVPEAAVQPKPEIVPGQESSLLASDLVPSGLEVSPNPPPREEANECPQCGRVCKSEFGLHSHMRKHSKAAVPA